MTLLAIPASQLETWARYVDSPSSKNTADSIKHALEDVRSEVRSRGRDVYLQGSYRNSTNLFRDSDVDVVIELTSTFYSDTSQLTQEEKTRFSRVFSDSVYSVDDFRNDVLTVLRRYYGAHAVTSGDKAIRVAGNGHRLDADVLVCAQYRKWHALHNDTPSGQIYVPGIVFFTQNDGRQVINYPKVHYDNGVNKHRETGEWYKPTVRMFKSARNRLVRDGYLPAGAAPSYFLEGLLYNIDNWRFGNSYQESFEDVLRGLELADLTGFRCQNEQLPLFGPTPEQWDLPLAKRFITEVRSLWNNWYSR